MLLPLESWSRPETAEFPLRVPLYSSLERPITSVERICRDLIAAGSLSTSMRAGRVLRFHERRMRSRPRRGRCQKRRCLQATWSSSVSTVATSITWESIQETVASFMRRVPARWCRTATSPLVITTSTSPARVASGALKLQRPQKRRHIETYSPQERFKIMCNCSLRAATQFKYLTVLRDASTLGVWENV